MKRAWCAALRERAERSGGKRKAVIEGVEAGAFGYILTLRLIPMLQACLSGPIRFRDPRVTADGSARASVGQDCMIQMTRRKLKADLVVIGAGSGGLSVAAGATQLGLKVVLLEQGELGGDCLNFGCVPSKALIASAAAAHQARRSVALGVSSEAVSVDFTSVMAHVHAAIAAIAPNEVRNGLSALG